MVRKIKAKAILRLNDQGLSGRAIARSLGIARQSVAEVQAASAAAGIAYPDVETKPDDEVYSMLFPGRGERESVYEQPDWARVHRELARVGVTLRILHGEYADECAAAGRPRMGYDRFCKQYAAYVARTGVTSRVEHKAGRTIEVDWAGKTMRIVDPVTGDVSKAYLFVAVLPFSRYAFVEPTLDMGQNAWLRCHVAMYEWFGGSTPRLVCDNLKTGVISHPRDGEVVLNDAYRSMAEHYSAHGSRAFDFDYMANVYEHPFEVVRVDAVPEEKSVSKAIGRHLDGCRIGFDAGGSDRKVSAVIDGESVYSEEVVWFPKTNSDPDYHYEGIVSALKAAAEHMPRVDAVGVSSAGIYIENRTMVASLFLKVPKDLFDAKVKDIYIRAIRDTFGDVPYVVANDGDVSALAGAMSLEDNNVLGIAMGPSEAVGYVDEKGNITGWLNELAFAPVDVSPSAMEDEWSGDIGCGVKYFSQDSVIKLAPAAGISLSADLSPAEKLKEVQKLMDQGGSPAEAIYRSIGVYLGHSLALYHHFYGFKHVLLLGRVMSGRGGDIILDVCKQVLSDEYPEVAGKINPTLPDEKARRVGQSVAAASLPELR